MRQVEVELRSLISKEKYDELLKFFRNLNLLFTENYHETYYFKGNDKNLGSYDHLRIYRTNKEAVLLFKKGKIHDEIKEEIEIKFKREEFEDLEKLFLHLGLKIQAKWFRKRIEFKWNDINVCLDDTKGYGYILELEKISDELNKNKDLEILNKKLKELKIDLTPKKQFDKKYADYLKNWQNLI